MAVVQSCEDCQRYNIGRKGFHPLTTIHAKLPMDHLAIDLKEYPKSTEGHKYCLVVIDICTRFVWLAVLKDKSALVVAQALWSILSNFGLPKVIQSDNGKEFVNQIIKQLVVVAHIDHRLVTAYHPQANGAAERMVQTSSQAVYKLLQGRDRDWHLYIHSVQLFINMKATAIHGSTPYSLMFARSANNFQDYSLFDAQQEPNLDLLKEKLDYMAAIVYPAISQKVNAMQAKYREQFTKSHKLVSDKYKPGAVVFVLNELRKSKPEERYTGPFVIKRRKVSGLYVLVDAVGTEFDRPVSSLKLAKASEQSNDGAGIVKEIMDDRWDDNGIARYLVQFKDTTIPPTWLKSTDFFDYKPIRTYFDKKWAARQSKKRGRA